MTRSSVRTLQAAAMAALTIAVGCGNGGGGKEPAGNGGLAAPPPPLIEEDRAGPTTNRGGVPAGFARTKPGAAAAATSYLSALHGLVDADVEARVHALEAIAARGADAVVNDALAGLDELDALVGEARQLVATPRIYLRDVPFAYSVEQFSAERARVAIWSVGVVVIEGKSEATEVWSTNVVDLVWEDDWRVWAWQRKPGPTPAAAPAEVTPPATLLDQVTGWDGFRYEVG